MKQPEKIWPFVLLGILIGLVATLLMMRHINKIERERQQQFAPPKKIEKPAPTETPQGKTAYMVFAWDRMQSKSV